MPPEPATLPLAVARPAQGLGPPTPSTPGGLAFAADQPPRQVGSLPTAVMLQQRVGQVVQTVAGVAGAVEARLTLCTTLMGSAVSQCKAAVANDLGRRIESIKRQCQGSIDCVTQQLANAQAEAASLAAQGGCPQTLAGWTAGQAVNLLRRDGPDALSQWIANPSDAVCPDDSLPVGVANPFAWRSSPGQTYGPYSVDHTTPYNPVYGPPPALPLGQAPGSLPTALPGEPLSPGESPPGAMPPGPVGPPPAPNQIFGGGPWTPPQYNCGDPPPPQPPPPFLPASAWEVHPEGGFGPRTPSSCGLPGVCCGSIFDGHGNAVTVDPSTGGASWSNVNGGGGGGHVTGALLSMARVQANYCYWLAQCGPGSGAGGGSGGGGGGGGGGPGQCPPPPTCPACNKPTCDCECVKKCNDETKKTATKWYVYKRGDGTCYVAEQTSPTEIEGDELVGDYDNETQAILTAQQCKPQPPTPTSSQPPVINNLAGGIWCSLDVCETIAAIDAGETVGDIDLPTWLQPALISGAAYVPANDQSIAGLPFAIRYPVALLKAAVYYPVSWIGAFLRGFACPASGVPEVVYSLNLYRAVVGFLGRFVGGVADDALIEPEQTVHYLCPQRIPTSAEADAAYLTDSIDASLWQCWVRANNDCDIPRQKIIDSKRSRLGVNEQIALYRRGLIDEETYNANIRQLGFLEPEQASQYYALSQQVPPVSELIRMMVRDVADEGLVQQFGMDDLFVDKWTGQLRDWGFSQGITDTFARYEWRAHWTIPSPGQLYEMYHRFRGLNPDDPRYVDESIITTALQQQDMLPYWIPRYLGISFRPLTRIDAGRAYEVGVLPPTALRTAYTDLGYSDENADTLVQFKRRQVAVRIRSLPIVTMYRKKLLNRTAVYESLLSQNYEPDSINSALDYAAMLSASETTAKCVSSTRKRYLLGEVNTAALQGILVGYGLDTEQAISTATAWECERAARGKLAPAEKLCRWFKSGIITQGDYINRLINLGWTGQDVQNHVDQCQKEIDTEALKLQLQTQRKQEAAAKAAAKAAQQLERQQQQQAQRMAKMALQEARLSRRQFQNITKAAQWLSKNTQMDWMTAYTLVIDGIRYGIDHYQLDWQAAIDSAVKVAYSTKHNDPAAIAAQMEQGMRAEWLAFQTSAIDGSEVL